MHFLKSCSGQTATVTSLKFIWNEGLDQADEDKWIIARDYAAYAA